MLLYTDTDLYRGFRGCDGVSFSTDLKPIRSLLFPQDSLKKGSKYSKKGRE